MNAGPVTHLDTIDWERLRALPALCLHRTLLLGLADPVPMPSPMSGAEGAWVRERVWPAEMRSIDAGFPFGFHRWCSCQHGTCWNCLNRRCDLCVHRQKGGPDVDDRDPSHWITGSHGAMVAPIVLREGQRPCRWVCRCPCAKTGPAPQGSRRPRRKSGPARAPEQVRHAEPGQTALFLLETP